MENHEGIVPELYCSDFDASLEFYTSVCGLSMLTYPFGRGMSLEIAVDDASALYDSVVARGVRIFLTLEERWYRRGESEVGNLQFVAMDPDGYLLRFAQHLGQREGSA